MVEPAAESGEEDLALNALSKAALAIGEDLALDSTLQHIVDSARNLVSADYAALGVFDQHGKLVEFVHSGIGDDQVASMDYCPEGEGLLGVLLKQPQSVIVHDIAADPRSVGFPEGHPPMTTFLGMPIVAGTQVLGNLYLTDKADGERFSQKDEQMIQLFARHAAIAIKNARRFQQVGQQAIGEERTRLGMDLHDGIIQSIYAVGLTLETIQMVMHEDQEKAQALLAEAVGGLNDAIRDIRNFILDLRPRRYEGDLFERLDRLVREFRANTMVKIEIDADPRLAGAIPEDSATALSMTMQEALANIARHARASSVNLQLRATEEGVLLSVEDDGQGFDVNQQDRTLGHGLANMRERAEVLGGRFSVESEPGGGTIVTMILPQQRRLDYSSASASIT